MGCHWGLLGLVIATTPSFVYKKSSLQPYDKNIQSMPIKCNYFDSMASSQQRSVELLKQTDSIQTSFDIFFSWYSSRACVRALETCRAIAASSSVWIIDFDYKDHYIVHYSNSYKRFFSKYTKSGLYIMPKMSCIKMPMMGYIKFPKISDLKWPQCKLMYFLYYNWNTF